MRPHLAVIVRVLRDSIVEAGAFIYRFPYVNDPKKGICAMMGYVKKCFVQLCCTFACTIWIAVHVIIIICMHNIVPEIRTLTSSVLCLLFELFLSV